MVSIYRALTFVLLAAVLIAVGVLGNYQNELYLQFLSIAAAIGLLILGGVFATDYLRRRTPRD